MNCMNVHVNQYGLLPARQAAYRQHHSTETAVTIVHNDIMSFTNAGFVSTLVLLDLSAAFDTVDHAILLEILTKRFGVENLELQWFRSYHTGCTQTFTTPSDSSATVAFTCSVPQGSMIGQRSSSWCSSRWLQLNPVKTKLIWFSSRANLVKLRQPDVMSVNLCSVAVEPVNSVRDLGVILDSELSMRVHKSKISSTCFFYLRRLRTLRPLIDKASAQRLASAFILSRVDNCNAVLAGLPTSTLAPLQRVLNAVAHFVADAASRAHVSGIM